MKTEVITYNGSTIVFKDPQTNVLTNFIKSMPKEFQQLTVDKLPDNYRSEYIKKTAIYILEGMNGSLVAAAQKCMTTLAHALNERKISHLELKIDFLGTKDEIKEEKFSFTIASGKHIVDAKSEKGIKDVAAKEKIDTFLNQPEKLLELHDQCVKWFSDDEVTHVMSAAGLVLLMDYLSAKNVAQATIHLNGLERAGEQLGGSYNIIVEREEQAYPVITKSIKLN